MQAQMLQIIQ
jgi:hypothetical protein